MNLSYAGVAFTWTCDYDDAGRLKSLQAPGVARPGTFTYDKAKGVYTAVYDPLNRLLERVRPCSHRPGRRT